MDCEKFESHLIDELYDELDEVTSAAAKRHVSGCARCASLSSGLKATKRVAVLPMVEPPADLEERILAATREAQKVVPIQGRTSRFISWAASRAMQPQTAMAALFLICIGTSALFLKGKSSMPSSAMSVHEEGAPAPVVAAAPSVARPMGAPGSSDEKTAAASPPPAAPPAASAAAVDDLAATQPTAPSRGYAPATKASPREPAGALANADSLNAAPAAGASSPKEKGGYGSGAIGGGSGPYAPPAPAPVAPPQAQAAIAPAAPSQKSGAPPSDFELAKQAYTDGDYSGARDQFDTLAATSGGLDAALWAARSEEGANGCATALPRYNDVTRRGPATRAGYDAQLAAGKCYRVMGDVTDARAKLVPLLGVPSHMALAQQELNAMGPRGGTGQAARAAPKASPPAATTDKASAY